jgi:hypothetical protein
MTDSDVKPSLTERALQTRRAIVMGIGGGGDVIQAIPVANYLRLLGVETIFLGGVSCQWWTEDGNPLSDTWGSSVLGPTVYDVKKLSEAEPWAPVVAGVGPRSNFAGKRPAEAVLADQLPADGVFVAGLTDGVVGLRDSLNQVIAEREIDLFVGVDIGSDSFHNGQEAQPAYTSLVDFMSLGAMTQLDCPVIYGVSGYGCDGEMQLDELDERVSIVMREGGYLGAYGLTQRDVQEMLRAAEAYPDPIEHWSPRAARGEFGTKAVNVGRPWGTVIHVTPLASVMMFFDPHTMVEHVSRGVKALAGTTSLAEAETIYKEELGQYPETLLRYVVHYFREE